MSVAKSSMTAGGVAWRRVALGIVVAVAWFVVGLAVSRLLYEARFPQWAALGRPGAALGLGLLAAVGGLALWRWRGAVVAAAALPLLVNLAWLLDPTVDLARGRFLFAAGWWAAAVVGAWWRVGDDARRWQRLGPLFVAAALLPVYLLTMSSAVGQADTFEFQVVAPQLGIAHPTGYPLYLLLGKLFSLLPLGTVAWRLNFASAVYGTLAAVVVFRLALDLLRRPLPALAGAVALGFVPVYWSQAIVAEVYTLHALLVATALWLMVRLVVGERPPTADQRPPTNDRRPPTNDRRPPTNDQRSSTNDQRPPTNDYPPPATRHAPPPAHRRKQVVALAFVIGLGLTNHVTSVFLLPPALLAVALRLLRDRGSGRRDLTVRPLMRMVPIAIAFAAPLLLYAYLPLRWRAVNGEAMGTARFIEWVAGGRFQGALQLMAWLRDPTRWAIVGRLLLDAWGWLLLAVAVVGLVWLLWRQWRAGVVLALAGGGFAFYALNYYVPDLAVFLIPTHVVVAVLVAAGVVGVLEGVEIAHAKAQRGQGRKEEKGIKAWSMIIFVAVMLPILAAVGGRWSAVAQSADDGGEPWARGVLALPLARGAAVLADSEKIAPLYYLQQIDGLRPDLDIMVLPDEAAYRAELEARLAAGQAVYLARYLPGLAGVYHLRSLGPLVEVSREPVTQLPAAATPSELTAGPLRLLGYVVEPVAAVDAGATGLTLHWTLARPLSAGEASPVVYLRWAGGEPVVAGRHPVGDSYPVNAWRPGEVVADFHLLPLPVGCETDDGCPRAIEVAVAPRFSAAADLDWQTVAGLAVAPRSGPVGQPQRALFEGFALDGVAFPAAARPGAALPLRFSGHGPARAMEFLVVPAHAVNSIIGGSDAPPAATVARSTAFAAEVEGATETGPHALIALGTGEPRAVCGWLQGPTTGCVVAVIAVSGAPLPAGAANFADKIALLDVAVDAERLSPGGQLPVTLTWQGLAQMDADYTVFVQVLDAADRIVGQVDAWPVQGTLPTSQWTPGETVSDPYLVQLSSDLPPGDYRLHVGLYLLATLERLAVVDESGAAVDDKVEIPIVSPSP